MLQALHAEARLIVVVAIDEKKSVGIDAPVGVEERQLVHARGELSQGDGHGVMALVAGRQGTEKPAHSVALYLQSQPFVACGLPLNDGPQGVALFLYI